MATLIRIATGGLTAERSYENDAAAQTILLRAAKRLGVESGTNQQKLLAIVDRCVRLIQDLAAEQQFDDERAALLQQSQEGNKLT